MDDNKKQTPSKNVSEISGLKSPHIKPRTAFFSAPKLICAAVIAAVAVGGGVAYAVTRPVTLRLSDYADITYSGYNGYGKAEVSVDNAKFYNDVYAAAKKKGKTKSKSDSLDLDDLYNDLSDLAAVYGNDDVLGYELSQSDMLSNGDDIELTWSADKDEFKDLGIRLDTTGKSTKVAGLEDADTIDPFDSKYLNVDDNTKGIHLSITGSSPMLRIWLYTDFDEAPYNKLLYILDTGGHTFLSDGDTVRILAGFGGETVDEEDGVILGRKETEVVIHGDSAYVTDMNQIKDSASLDQMKTDIQDYIETHNGMVGQKFNQSGYATVYDNSGDSSYYSDAVIESYEFIDEYLGVVKDGYFSKDDGVTADAAPYSGSDYYYSYNYENYGSGEPYNCFYTIVKVHLSTSSGERDGYMVVNVPNINVDSNGKLADASTSIMISDYLYDSSETAREQMIDIYNSYYTANEVNQSWTW